MHNIIRLRVLRWQELKASCYYHVCLKYLRDSVLNNTPEGQEIIKLYYQWSPAIVIAMEEDEGFQEEMEELIDGVLGLRGEEKTCAFFPTPESYHCLAAFGQAVVSLVTFYGFIKITTYLNKTILTGRE